MDKQINCPVEFMQVNENKVRVIALLVLASGLFYGFTQMWFVLIYLAVDFGLRTAGLESYSVYARLAGFIIRKANIKNKPVNRAPKRFAAGLGFVFVLAILSAHVLGYKQTALWLTGILCIFAFLESFLAVCIGCYTYHYLNKAVGIVKKSTPF